MRVFVILFFLVSCALAATYHVGGGYGSTINAAITAADVRDSVVLHSGSGDDSLFLITSAVAPKRGVSISSYGDQLHTIQRDTLDQAILINPAGDSCKFHGLEFAFQPGGYNLFQYMYNSAVNTHGHTFTKCRFVNNNDYYSRFRGLYLLGDTAITFDSCYFYNTYYGIYGLTARTIVKNSYFNISNFSPSPNSQIINTVIRGATFEQAQLGGGPMTYRDCWFNPSIVTGLEYISYDDLSNTVNHVLMENCVFDSVRHVGFSWDNAFGDTIRNCTFNMRNVTGSSLLHNHGQNSFSDTGGYNMVFRNNAFSGKTGFDAYEITALTNDPVYDIRWENILCTDPSNLNLRYTIGMVVDSCVFKYSNTIDSTGSSGITITDNNVWNAGYSYIVDTTFKRFHTWDSPYDYAGPATLKHWFYKNGAQSISETSFAVSCSVSTYYRHDNQYQGDDIWSKNSFFAGDTVKAVLECSIDKSAWERLDSANIPAGGNIELVAEGVTTDNGAVYYRISGTGRIENETFISDVSLVDSLQLSAAAIKNWADTIFNAPRKTFSSIDHVKSLLTQSQIDTGGYFMATVVAPVRFVVSVSKNETNEVYRSYSIIVPMQDLQNRLYDSLDTISIVTEISPTDAQIAGENSFFTVQKRIAE